MNEELVKHRLDVHEKRINAHGERLDKIEAKEAETRVMITNLCKSIEGLTEALSKSMEANKEIVDKSVEGNKCDIEKQNKKLDKFIGAFITALIGFFMFMIQQTILKGW